MNKNPYAEIFTAQINAATQGMNEMLKANQSIYDAFQAQMLQIIKQNQEIINSTSCTFLDTLKAESDDLLRQVKEAMAVIKKPGT